MLWLLNILGCSITPLLFYGEVDCGSDTSIHIEEGIVDKTSMSKSQPHSYSISLSNV